ncbi:hypothetical protein [Calothrix rhizosoleniae]|uniref:hypothetical protein n=1 Tax=Calothrix rhizosoleniae TaxID=888997 RepID=UPI0013565894|nr:hypothetical protein [Calothrix rhizosoleniae]
MALILYFNFLNITYYYFTTFWSHWISQEKGIPYKEAGEQGAGGVWEVWEVWEDEEI